MEAIALKHAEERTKILECICQSRQFAAEYDRKKEALQKAKEETQYNFNKKKAAISERKQMFKEKKEVSPGEKISRHFCTITYIRITHILHF